jgi:hypothetical protein
VNLKGDLKLRVPGGDVDFGLEPGLGPHSLFMEAVVDLHRWLVRPTVGVSEGVVMFVFGDVSCCAAACGCHRSTAEQPVPVSTASSA